MGNAHRILVGKPEREKTLGKFRNKREDNIKMRLERGARL
jgi:hypothetical protein